MSQDQYIELHPDDVIREGDMRVRNGHMLPVSMSYIGKPVSDYAPLTVVRPRTTVIHDALLRVRDDLRREFCGTYYRANFSYIDDALGEINK